MSRRALLAVLLALLAAGPALASSAAPWGPVIARPSNVTIEHRDTGLVRTFIDLYPLEPSVTPSVYQIEATCAASSDSLCLALYAPRSWTSPCSWSALPAATRSALVYILGGAWCGPEGHPTCYQSSGVFPWGERYVAESWTCNGSVYASECLATSGTLTPGLRIDGIVQTSGCGI